MQCPVCKHSETKVIDSRPVSDGSSIRRRRECEACGHRVTTYERYEVPSLFVIKKYGAREPFDRAKVLRGLVRACEKRDVSIERLEKVSEDIEKGLLNLMKKEVKTSFIGKLILESLKEIDEVAYIRFASVYREFDDIDTFINEIENLRHSKGAKGI